MTVVQALVLGVLQGLTEFLPVSSSAHLALAPWLFGWPEPGLSFDVALHLGTLVAVLVYFRREWIALLGAIVEMAKNRRVETREQRRVLYLVVATIPGGIGGLLLEKYAERTFRAPIVIAVAMIAMGLVLWIVDRLSRQERSLDNLGLRDAIVVGCAQVLALVPGVSRSGATITAGRALQLDRESAATFSFLMSMPIIAAAAVLKVPHAIRESGVSLPLVIGVLASAISGWLAISILLRFVSRHSYGVFALYRVLLGGAVIALALARR
ncbi:MAG: undecaprenyl-diphosphatase UppP [Gemmatimonadaceae bacterium]